jgi:hypothetical protein
MDSNISINLKWGLFIIHFRLHKMESGIQNDPPGNFRDLNWTSNRDLSVASFSDYWNVSANHVSRNLSTCTVNFSIQEIRYGWVAARSTGHMLRVGSAERGVVVVGGLNTHCGVRLRALATASLIRPPNIRTSFLLFKSSPHSYRPLRQILSVPTH